MLKVATIAGGHADRQQRQLHQNLGANCGEHLVPSGDQTGPR